MLRLTARLVLLRVRIEADKGRPVDASCRAVFEKLPNGALQTFAKEVERWHRKQFVNDCQGRVLQALEPTLKIG